jgi:hypothetical protein
MRNKLLFVLIVTLSLTLKTYCQYKDLEGVFFGKVISLGVGGSLQKYSDKSITGTGSITPIIYSVFINNKLVSSVSMSFYKKVSAEFQGNDGYDNYTQTAQIKQFELAVAYRFAITPGGVEKPFSAFVNLQTGLITAKTDIKDSRYGDFNNDQSSMLFVGGGFTVYQRLGSRFIAFAEPVYKYPFGSSSGNIYLGDSSEKVIKLNHFSGQLGIMFLIGKS